MTLVDNFQEFWEENKNIELKEYPRKEIANKAWDYQQAKLKKQAARIEALSAVIRDIRSEDIEWFKKNGNYSITLTLRQKMAALINAQDTQG